MACLKGCVCTGHAQIGTGGRRDGFAAMMGMLVALLPATTSRAEAFDPSDDDPNARFRLEYLNFGRRTPAYTNFWAQGLRAGMQISF